MTATGEPTDPTDVTLLYSEPDGTVVEVPVGDLDHGGAGVYSYALDTTDKPGTWRYRFVGTGVAQAAGDRSFVVDAATVVAA